MSISTSTATASGLAALEDRLRDDFLTLGWPAKAWVPATSRKGQPVHDVIVIGAGQAGLALNVALQQVGIKPVLLDKSPLDFEGPWATTARMETLRSPKELTGPAMGIAVLSFRAWFVAQFGLEAWAALDKIPRLQWMDYLRWYRRVTNADVRNSYEVVAVRPQADGVVEVDVKANGVIAMKPSLESISSITVTRDSQGKLTFSENGEAMTQKQEAASE